MFEMAQKALQTIVKKGPTPGRRQRSLLVLTLGLFGFALFSWAQQPEKEGSPRQIAAKLQSVRLLPQEEATLWGVGAKQRFVVLGRYDDGLERDLTRRSRFSISDSGVAEVNGEGRVRGLAPGRASLKADVEGLEVEAMFRVEELTDPRPFRFDWDIGKILTARGCNNKSCHGSVPGREGFKLSRNALVPRQDYGWIVEGGTFKVLTAETGEKNPRVNTDRPEESLLLLKPTFAVAHGGGQRFEVGSEDYATLLEWIRRGAPYSEQRSEGGVKVERLEVFPKEVVLDQAGEHQLLVTAHFSNGQREDLTDQVRYESQNPEVAEVTGEGLLRADGVGETVIWVHTAGHTAMVTAGVISRPISDYPETPGYNFIDDYVFAKMRKFHLLPSPLSSDEEFLRRICLDLTGTLPPPNRAREFLKSSDPQKREKLVEILLESPEFVDHWSWRLGDYLRVTGTADAINTAKPVYEEWLAESVAGNKPYDQMARERIAAEGYNGPSRHFADMGGNAVPLPQNAMAEQVRVFLGRRMDCAQCHDHPYENWTQNQFWGMSAFFGQISNMHPGRPQLDFVIFEDPNGFYRPGDESKVIHPRSKEEVQPRFLDGTLLPENRRDELRVALAKWMTSRDNPYFAQAIANRMWGYFMGRGIVDPVDDFGLAHPPTHPQLLEALGREFVESGHDLRALIRLIVGSRTYQLSGTPNETNQYDRVNYSRSVPRPLETEVLLHCITQVTEVPGEYGEFERVYDKPDRTTIPKRNHKASLNQGLHQLAGPTFTTKLSQKGGRVDRLLNSSASDDEIIEELYLAALSRFPSPEKQSKLKGMIQERDSRREAIEDLLWGVLNSEEFLHNH